MNAAKKSISAALSALGTGVARSVVARNVAGMPATRIEVGTKVTRILPRLPALHGTPGEIVAVTDERVQILWSVDIAGKPRKSWQQRKAQGKRWQLA